MHKSRRNWKKRVKCVRDLKKGERENFIWCSVFQEVCDPGKS